MAEEEKREVERMREEDQEAQKTEQAENDEDRRNEPRTGMEGEENGYAEAQDGMAAEGPGWEGDSGEELGDEPQIDDETATFFYKEGEREHAEEEDIGIAGRVKARHSTGGRQAAGTPPS